MILKKMPARTWVFHTGKDVNLCSPPFTMYMVLPDNSQYLPLKIHTNFKYHCEKLKAK